MEAIKTMIKMYMWEPEERIKKETPSIWVFIQYKVLNTVFMQMTSIGSKDQSLRHSL